VHEVIAIVLGDLEWFSLYALIQALQTEWLTYTHTHSQFTATPRTLSAAQATQLQGAGRLWMNWNCARKRLRPNFEGQLQCLSAGSEGYCRDRKGRWTTSEPMRTRSHAKGCAVSGKHERHEIPSNSMSLDGQSVHLLWELCKYRQRVTGRQAKTKTFNISSNSGSQHAKKHEQIHFC
jgi:hypothetical protein